MKILRILRRILNPRISYTEPSFLKDGLQSISSTSLKSGAYLDLHADLCLRIKNHLNLHNSDVYLLSSGRSCIEFLLNALKRKYPHKDQVIIPSYACRALLDAVTNCGLDYIYVDINETLLPDHKHTLSLIGKNTLACFFHNLGGRDNNSDIVLEACIRHNATVIDDHCQSFFLPKRAHKNIVTVLSFAPSKTLAATAGGALICADRALNIDKYYHDLDHDKNEDAQQRLSFYSRKYQSLRSRLSRRIFGSYQPQSGFRAEYTLKKMSAMDAKICTNMIDSAPKMQRRLQENFLRFKTLIEDKLSDKLHAYSGLESKEFLMLHFKRQKDKMRFQELLNSKNIELQELYVPLHLQFPPLQKTKLSNTERFSRNVLNFPIRPNLTSGDKLRIIEVLSSMEGNNSNVA